MINAADIQAFLLGGGGALGMSMAGIGVYRLCSSAARRFGEVPQALTIGAAELGRMRVAVERDQSMAHRVVEQGGILKVIQEDIAKIRSEREEIGRELRLMSRRLENVNYAPTER